MIPLVPTKPAVQKYLLALGKKTGYQKGIEDLMTPLAGCLHYCDVRY